MTRQAAVRYGRPRVCDYWCQLVACVQESEAEWFLGGALVPTPRLAVRWLRGQAERISGALHPDPLDSPYPRACLRPVPAEGGAGAWIPAARWEDTCRIERMLAALLVGEPVTVAHTVADRFAGRGDVRVRYEFSARPVPAHTSARSRAWVCSSWSNQASAKRS